MLEYQKASVALENTFPKACINSYLYNIENVRSRENVDKKCSINIILFLESTKILLKVEGN